MRRSAVRRISDFGFGQPQMSFGFGGVVVTKHNSDHIHDAGVKRSVLDNGVTIVTHDKGSAASTVGFFADAGVKYDPATAPGLTHFARFNLLSGNMSSSLFQIDRAFRAIGAAYGNSEIQKQYVGVWAQSNRSNWRVAVENFAPAFAAPRFADSDLERWRDNLDAQREETRWNHPREYSIDELETVAFYKEPLGNPRMVPVSTNDKCNQAKLIEKFATFMTPQRITVVGVNVPHQDLVASYTSQPFIHSASAPHHRDANPAVTPRSEADQYVGNKSRYEYENRGYAMATKPDMDPEGIIAVGWRSVGAQESASQYAAGLVYAEMMSIAAGESASRVGAMQTSHGIQAFYRPYSTTGLTGYTIRDAPGNLNASLERALKMLPTDFVAHLPAAKARAVARLFSTQLEMEADYAAFLATSKYSADDLIEAINRTNVNAVAEVAESMKKADPCFFATGDVMGIPSMRTVNAALA